MDHLTQYVELIKAVIEEWTSASESDPLIETLVVFDDDHQQYLMISSGWTPTTRAHAILFHARLHEKKVWIEWDGTHPSMTEELLRRGLTREDIVFNWHDPTVRTLSQTQTAENT